MGRILVSWFRTLEFRLGNVGQWREKRTGSWRTVVLVALWLDAARARGRAHEADYVDETEHAEFHGGGCLYDGEEDCRVSGTVSNNMFNSLGTFIPFCWTASRAIVRGSEQSVFSPRPSATMRIQLLMVLVCHKPTLGICRIWGRI